MIELSDLKRIKKIFDRVARTGAKTSLAVKFTPIDDNSYSVIMSNGEDYARLISSGNLKNAIQISWEDFCRICDLFNKEIDIIKRVTFIEIIEGKTKLKCSESTSRANEFCNFKFDFDNAIILSLNNVHVVTNQGAKGTIDKFVLGKNMLVSTDSHIVMLNKLSKDIGEDIHILVDMFPEGSWYFNPNSNIIVSEDKRIAMTLRKGNGQYPFDGIVKLSQLEYNNYFEVELKDFKDSIDKCSKVDNKIKLQFTSTSIELSCLNGGINEYHTSINAKYDHVTSREFIKFDYKYLKEFCRCAENGKLKICFSDNASEQKMKSELDNLIVFAIGLA